VYLELHDLTVEGRAEYNFHIDESSGFTDTQLSIRNAKYMV
jgi:hypothetical protein